MIIRPMELEDIDQVVFLENMVWTSHTTPAPLPVASREKIIQQFEMNTHFLVALEGGEIVGVLNYEDAYPFPSGSHIVTFGIAVAKESRGLGVGRKLIEVFLNQARENYKKVVIHVLSSNQDALPFYQKLGFKQEARLKNQFYIDEHYVDDLIYTYNLGDSYAR